MFANSVVELLKSDTEGKFGFALAALFGGGLNTFSPSTDWEQSTSKEMTQFKAKVGEAKFKEANDKFNSNYQSWLAKSQKNTAFTELPDEAKQDVISDAKEKIKQDIFKSYRFKATKAKPKTAREKRKLKSLLL